MGWFEGTFIARGSLRGEPMQANAVNAPDALVPLPVMELDFPLKLQDFEEPNPLRVPGEKADPSDRAAVDPDDDDEDEDDEDDDEDEDDSDEDDDGEDGDMDDEEDEDDETLQT
jgi:hypothetical protein